MNIAMPPATMQQDSAGEAERLHRKQRLAGTFRLFAREGFGRGRAGHVTVRDPILTDHFWVNPWGKYFGRIRVSDLILVNDQGVVVDGAQKQLNQAAFTIHSHVHRARPEVNAAAHAHSTYGKAFSAFHRLLEPITQDACVFYQDLGLDRGYGGVARPAEEGERIAAALGPRKAAILAHHGLITVGQSIDEAAWWFIALENACQVQLAAMAAGKYEMLSHEQASLAASQIGRPKSGWHNFQVLWDMIVAEEPDLLD